MIEQELKKTLGKNIKFFRFRRQFSQADLAEEAFISVTFLSNIERGNNFPQAKTLCNLADALEVEVWELFKDDGLSDQEAPIIDSISEDFKKHVNLAMEMVYKQYNRKYEQLQEKID
ncbi:MAG: helix-turn-helix domain-containing protein [Treponema sp.]|jgi:transcriptional regulator with XRE-family HTH domain|nr:helix-turn-helix domain-containing protein [Treponema sp.]